jgi:hypothetical protein
MKTVQKLALLLVALFVAHGAIAQTKTKSVIETDSTTVTTIVKTFPKFFCLQENGLKSRRDL